MMTASLIQKELLQALREELIPWAKSDGVERLILVEEPLRAPPQVQISHHECPPPPRSGGKRAGAKRAPLAQWHWPEAGLHAIRFPYMGCVLEGEADLRVGTTTPGSGPARRRQGRLAARSLEYQVLSLPARTFFVIPPGVFHPDASLPHWERPHLETARSRILWLHILPTGALCHTCDTQGAQHHAHSSLFVADAQLMNLTTLLMEEQRERSPHHESVAAAQLFSLLLRIERGLSQRHLLLTQEEIQPFEVESKKSLATPSLALTRSCDYIQTHLHEALSPEEIARHAFVSTAHLNRLFRAEVGLAVMQYVTQCRIEMARSLLENTDLSIGEIARMVGYEHASHFSQTFSRLVAVSPLLYRQKCKSKS